MHLLVLQSVPIHETASEVPAMSAHGCVSLETWPPPFPDPLDAAEGLVAGGPSPSVEVPSVPFSIRCLRS